MEQNLGIHQLVVGINNMENELREYELAVTENIEASKAETQAMLRKRLARQRLHSAKQALWEKEHELLEI